RHSGREIQNFPGHAADVQTGRPGDFVVGRTVFHVTVAPSRSVVEKCKENVAAGLNPILLVPANVVVKAKPIVEFFGLAQRMSVIAIEDFVALNIVELAEEAQVTYREILNQIIKLYNLRLEAVETDMSLRIEAP
ncbi:MAG: DUF4928 family protein, partial [Candidatus Promineifilaceae bacterium]